MAKLSFYSRLIKRAIDVIGAGTGIIVSAPLVAAISVAIKVESRGPVLYRQQRIGLESRSFEMLKFRSMLRLEDSYNSMDEPLENYDRVTQVGRFLRATSVDELPQLFNVIRGDMSLVGPRPTLRYQVERYDSKQRGRLEVRPGLTGLAQVSGRNSLTWAQKIDYDLQYIKELSFNLDLQILLRTVSVILKQDAVTFQGHDSLSRHDGDYRMNI